MKSDKWLVSGEIPRVANTHVAKHKRKAAGLEVVFDPQDHKDFLTGFSKRKKQRRKEAMKNLEKLEREERLAERAERRRIKKAQMSEKGDGELQLQASDDEGNQSGVRKAKGSAVGNHTSVKVYEGAGGATTTVTTMAIHNSSSESDGAVGADEDPDEGEEANTSVAVPERVSQQKASKRSKLLAHLKEMKKGKQAGGGGGKGRKSSGKDDVRGKGKGKGGKKGGRGKR